MFKKLDWKLLLIHLVILWGVTAVGGMIIGFTTIFIAGKTGLDDIPMELFGYSNMLLVFLTLVFITIINRISWLHFIALFGLFSVTSLVNVLFMSTTALTVLLGGLVITVFGGLGKLFGHLILMFFFKKES